MNYTDNQSAKKAIKIESIDDCYVGITYDAVKSELLYSFFYIAANESISTTIPSSQKERYKYYYSCARVKNFNELNFDGFKNAVEDYDLSAKERLNIYVGDCQNSDDFWTLHLLHDEEIDGKQVKDGNAIILMKFDSKHLDPTNYKFTFSDFFIGRYNTESESNTDNPAAVSIPIFFVKYKKFLEINNKSGNNIERVLKDFLRRNQAVTYTTELKQFIISFFNEKLSSDADSEPKDHEPFNSYCLKLYKNGGIEKFYNLLMTNRMSNVFLSIYISFLANFLLSFWTLEFSTKSLILYCSGLFITTGMLVFFAYFGQISSTVKKKFDSALDIINKCDGAFTVFFRCFTKVSIEEACNSKNKSVAKKVNAKCRFLWVCYYVFNWFVLGVPVIMYFMHK